MMINNIDVSFTEDNAVSLRQFVKQHDVTLDDDVIVQDFYLREYSLRDFMIKRYYDLDTLVSEAYFDKDTDCLTITLVE